MADISKVRLTDGTEYGIKDSTARNDVDALTTRVSTAENNIVAVDSRVTTAEGKITTLESTKLNVSAGDYDTSEGYVLVFSNG